MDMEVTLWEGKGHPIVFAKTKHIEGAPTILLYHHYDVQPVDPLDLWDSNPFEPEMRDGKVYARGASDNKGQCFHSITAVKAFLEAGGKCNIKLLIEGEEEGGSAAIKLFIPEKKDELQCDHVLVVDIGTPGPEIPAVTLGMRGIVAITVQCVAAKYDLHSGEHGGIAYNPNRALAEVIAKLWDEEGCIAIPGFTDDLQKLSDEDMAVIDFSFDEAEYRKEFGVRKLVDEGGISPMMANWLKPTIEINGMNGGYAGEGFKTIIPAKASAKISCRLPPGLKPDKVERQLVQFLQEHIAEGMEINVDSRGGGSGYCSSVSNPTVQLAAKAYEEVFKKPCLFVMTGGSIPITTDLAQATGKEPILVGTALATDQIHAPNEHFVWSRFEQGFAVMANVFKRMENE
ncbi:MAG: dipeptidase [Chlamydiales bacterium]